MSNVIMLYDYLNLKEIDVELNPHQEPGKDDISFLIQVAQQIPKNQQDIDNLEAGQLASYCLAAFQRSGELLSKATLWLGYKKIELDSIYGSLISESERPATITKEISKSDSNYIKAAKEHEKAKSYVEFYTGLMSSFEKGHYWAKSKEQANAIENKMSGYDVHEIKQGGKQEGKQVSNITLKNNVSNQAVEDVSF